MNLIKCAAYAFAQLTFFDFPQFSGVRCIEKCGDLPPMNAFLATILGLACGSAVANMFDLPGGSYQYHKAAE